MEPDIAALFYQLSSGSQNLSIKKLLQHCNACNFLKSFQLSKADFTNIFQPSNHGFESHEHSNSGSLSLAEFCQGLIVISRKTKGSLLFGTNFPSAKACPKSVARSVIDILKRTNMLLLKDRADPMYNRDAAVPKLQIPPNISTWLSSEPASTQRLKILTRFASQHKGAPKQKSIVDLYAGASSSETNRLQRRREAEVGSQSARPAPVPPAQANTESHGARTARFLRRL
jgi:hypothetical protein